MRSIATLGALALFAAAPLAAQGKFRTGEIDQGRRQPTTTTGSVLRGVLGRVDTNTTRRRNSDHIPPGQLPPAGMCRIWIDGVPPGQQPAPTDCQTAVANKPANARVIWGDQTGFPGKGKGKGKFKHGDAAQNGAIGRRHGDDEDDDDDRYEDRGRTSGGIGQIQRGDRRDKEKENHGKSVAKRGKKG